MSAPAVIVVDVDGVLINGRPSDGRRWDTDLSTDLGLCPKLLHDAFFRLHWPDILVGRADLRDRLASVLAVIAPQLTADALIEYWFAQDARLDVELLETLGQLRRAGYSAHLATNQEPLRADHLWRTLGLASHFDGLHFSAALGCRKPEQAFFGAVAKRIGRTSCDLLLVDDSPANVAAARDAGWAAEIWHPARNLADVVAMAEQARGTASP